MSLRKMHKKDFQPKLKDQIGDTMHHARSTNNKVKYNHKNYWLEEDMEVVPYRMKKKKVKVFN